MKLPAHASPHWRPARGHGALAVLAVPLLLAPCVAGTQGHAAVTPLQKVIELLTNMESRAKSEKQAERVQYAAFEQFCTQVTADKQNFIKAADDKIEILGADIDLLLSDVERMGQERRQHEADVVGWHTDEDAANMAHTNDTKHYTQLIADYSESIHALTQAISVLKQQAYDRPQAVSLLKKLLPTVKAHAPGSAAHRAMEAFLAQDPEESLEIPQVPVNAYEFKSHDIIELLEGLKDKFRDERSEAEKEQMSRRHAYEMIMQDLHDSIKASETAQGNLKIASARANQEATDKKSQLADVQASRDSEAKYLEDLTSTCQQKSKDFQARQKLRQDELDNLAKAIAILSSSEVSGTAGKYLPSLAQGKTKGTALVQIGRGPDGTSASPSANQQRIADFLRTRSEKLGSRVLSVVATRIREGPFDKVKRLIEELLQRLLAQAGEEAQHKGWCDQELGTNEQTRQAKTSEIESLHTTIDELETRLEQLAKDIADASTQAAELQKALAEAQKIRNEEALKNAATISEAQDAQEAVSQAISLLKDFYKEAAKATSLMQGNEKAGSMAGNAKGQQEPPPIFDEPYKGLQTEGSNVLSILEVVHSDFARLESDTHSEEVALVADYEQFVTDTSAAEAQLQVDLKHYRAEQQDKELQLDDRRTDLDTAKSQLQSANQYYDKLKPACINVGMSYSERVQRRQEEIEALQEALRILEGASV